MVDFFLNTVTTVISGISSFVQQIFIGILQFQGNLINWACPDFSNHPLTAIAYGVSIMKQLNFVIDWSYVFEIATTGLAFEIAYLILRVVIYALNWGRGK